MLSTTFSTPCPLLKKNLCCATSSPDGALESLRKFLKEIEFTGELEFQKANKQGFRRKVKLAIRGDVHDPLIGIYKEGTHDVVDMGCCLIQHEKINRFIEYLKDAIRTFQIAPYSEKNHRGTLRYVQVVLNEGDRLQVVLVLNSPLEVKAGFLHHIECFEGLHSFWVNYQEKISNTIFGEKWQHVWGEMYLPQKIMGETIFFHPAAFCQSNLMFFENILQDVSKHMDKYAKAIDLYSGVGLFGLCLHKHFDWIGFAESNPYSKESFEASLRYIKLASFEFFVGDAKAFLQNHLDAECVIIDPPRKGLHKEIKPLLGALKKGAKLFYISCGYLSLIRDVKELTDMGFILDFVKGYDCFPGSSELESLCVLTYVPKADR